MAHLIEQEFQVRYQKGPCLDSSGPTAPRGQTPILQYDFNWTSLSVAAGLTLWNSRFRIYAGAIKKSKSLTFLESAASVTDPTGSASGTPIDTAGFLLLIFRLTRQN